MIFDRYSSYFISQFDRICTENNIILFCISLYSFYLLQLFDIGYFAILKYIYRYFVNDLVRTDYNYIDKLDFLADYLYTKIETFQSNIVQNSFVTTGIIPVDTEKVFSKFTICLRISILQNSQPNSRSSEFLYLKIY